jgi:hypothetical protein
VSHFSVLIVTWLQIIQFTRHTHSRSSPAGTNYVPISLTLILLMWRIGRAPNSIPIYEYIQQDATLLSLFIAGNCSTCFGWCFHPSTGVYTTVSTASGICHTVTAICCYRGRVGTGLSVLWVAYATHSTLKSNPRRGEIFDTRRDRPLGPPSLLYSGQCVILGCKAVRAWHWI